MNQEEKRAQQRYEYWEQWLKEHPDTEQSET